MSITTRRYAYDLYNLALQDEKVDLYFNTFNQINERLNIDRELAAYLDSTTISTSDKKEGLQKAFNNTLDNDVLTTFFIMNNAINQKHTELLLIQDFWRTTIVSRALVLVWFIRSDHWKNHILKNWKQLLAVN